jgi:rhamnogalacturonan endolyase
VYCVYLNAIHVVREGDSTVYLATAEPSVGELRFIARLKASVLPYEYPFGSGSTTGLSCSAFEGSDVYPCDRQTRSKFCSSERFIDENVHCAQGASPSEVYVCILVPQHESSSGGPLYRDINSNQVGMRQIYTII